MKIVKYGLVKKKVQIGPNLKKKKSVGQSFTFFKPYLFSIESFDLILRKLTNLIGYTKNFI